MRSTATIALLAASVALGACEPEPPVFRAEELEALGSQELPARMLTGVAVDEDRSGDLRPEAVAILDAIAAGDGPTSLADLRALRLVEAAPALGPTLRAWSPPATIRVWRRGVDGSSSSCSGRVDVIPFDKYVKGVLPHEWITSWHEESLKAGAVVIRTYAAAWIDAGGKYTCADLDDTTASQVYKDQFLAKTDAAVDATAGIYVVKDGALVFAEYSAENGDPTKFGVAEPHCTGLSLYGHGRGTCQWGTQRWATNSGKTFDWIATHYYPGSELVGIARTPDAGFVAESYQVEMTAGDEVVVWLEYENTGNTTWVLDDTQIGTTMPRDRQSPFFVEGNWVSPSRTTGADHSNYAPGTVGRFTWLMRAPEVTETTVFEEHFALVTAEGAWFGPADDAVKWTITVHPTTGPTEPGRPDDPGAIDGDGDARDSGGCSAASAPQGILLSLFVGLLLVPLLRRRRASAVAALATLALLLPVVGCTPPAGEGAEGPRYRASALGGESELRELFLEAERRFGVPAEILATFSYVETRLRFVGAYDDGHAHDGHAHVGRIGLMALGEGGPRDVARGAELSGFAADDVHTDARANIMAGAALLAAQADNLASPPRALGDWRPALAAFAGEDADGPVTREVFRRIDLGWRIRDAEGAWILQSARPLATADLGDGMGKLSQGVGYPGAIWNPAHSSNYTAANRSAAQIKYIIVHTVQGSYAGCISWFKNPSANVAAHYVVRSSDGEITQMVDDRDIGWHVACFNQESIGIEHEGYVQDPDVWYTEPMYIQSAKLTSWLADQYNIPKDRAHIMGHGEAPDCSSHTDPGSGWNWDHYMNLVKAGGAPTYDASYVGKEAPAELRPGEEAVVWFEFTNGSNITWDLNETRLGTAEPRDRESPFYVDGNWMSPNRPTGADHSTYAPGATGRFTFLIRAPEVSAPTEFVEHFQLVQEGQAWFGPVVSMTIRVVPEGAGDDDDPTRPDDDGKLDGTDGPGGERDGLSGGCRAAGSADSGAYAILVCVAFLLLRRRRAH